MTTVATKPAKAPCNRRVSDSPCRIEGISMDHFLSLGQFRREQRTPEWSGQIAELTARPLRAGVSAD
jgi:hypothetical protein